MTGDQALAEVLALLKAGRLAEATARCLTLAADRADDPRAHALLARAYNLQGSHEQARTAAERAASLGPSFVPAWLELAQASRALGEPGATATALEALVALQPGHAGAWADLGATLLETGDHARAEAALRRALALSPTLVDARFRLARIEHESGRLAAALAGYEACCEARADGFEAWFNRGLVLAALLRPREGVAALARAVALAPDRSEPLRAYCRALVDARADPRLVVEATRRLTVLEPESASAWHALATALRRNHQDGESHGALARALDLDPRFLPARWDRFQLPDSLVRGDAEVDRAFLDRWRTGLEYFEQLDLDSADVRAQLAQVDGLETNFHLHYLGEAFVDLQVRYARVVERLAHAQAPAGANAPVRRARGGGRIRIGFASGLFHDHSVMRVFRTLIKRLPRDRFELVLLHMGARRDAVTESLAARADRYLGGTRSMREWPAQVAAQDLDVLAYVDVGMHPNSEALAAYRCAPLQVALWGHPVTTGSRHIDCFLSADAMEAADADRHYSERLVRLPRLGTCYPTPSWPVAPTLPAAAQPIPGRVHYLLAQNVVKLTPVHDRLMARIALALPQALFTLVPHPAASVCAAMRARIAATFSAHGLDPDHHLRVLPWLPEPAFGALALASEVNLDSVGFSGGITSFELFRFDLPTVTLPGALLRSRQTAGMLRLMGIEDLIATDLDDYVRIAVELGRDAERRAALRARIAERKHVLYDDQGVIDAFAAFIERELS